MLFINKLSAFAALTIFFASQAQALDVNVISATCNFFAFTISVDSVDFQLADYATFYVANAAALNTDYSKISYSIKAGGDITQSNYPFTFRTEIPGTAPGGSQWRIGVALDDSNGNVLTTSDAEAWTYIANPCGSPTATPVSSSSTIPGSSSSPTSPSTTTTSIRPDPTTYTATPIPPPTPVSIPAIAGGVIGAVALFVAMGLFICLRKRKAAQQAHHQQNRSADGVEKGYISHDPIHSVNTLPRAGHNSNLSDFIAKDESINDRTTSVPPMSPRSSQWNASNVGPMSPSLSATSAPSRANNPLTNSNIGSWTTNVNTSSGQENQFGNLPEPMSRR